MNLEEIKELITFLNDTRFTELEIEQEGIHLRVSQEPLQLTTTAAPAAPVATVTAVPAATPAVEAPATAAASGANVDVRIPPEPVPGHVITSPIVGTFYSAPAPDKPAYVAVGDTVKKGQVICIVEAMKLMNEIESEFNGTVDEILVEDGEPVEFGQAIMRIK